MSLFKYSSYETRFNFNAPGDGTRSHFMYKGIWSGKDHRIANRKKRLTSAVWGVEEESGEFGYKSS